MQLLNLFVLCFFPAFYILTKLKQNRLFRVVLGNRGILLSVTVLISFLVAFHPYQLFGYVVYITLFYLILDLICFILTHMNGKIYHAFCKVTQDGIVICILAVVVTVYSSFHVHQIVTTKYTIQFEKQMTMEKKLMLITDMHLGTAVNETIFDMIEDRAMEEKPDILLFAGDIFDENTSDELMEKGCQKMASLSTMYNVYYVLGNHEYVRGGTEKLLDTLKNMNVKVLIDDTVLVDDCFYLIGRMDQYSFCISKENRVSLEQLMQQVDVSYPVILADHQPVEIDKARELGVDLVLSGHTHAGQFFPLSFFTEFVNERLYGMDIETVESPFYTIVSSRIGAWGMAMRNASDSEIVVIDLHRR